MLQESPIVLAVVVRRGFIFNSILFLSLVCTLCGQCSLNADARLKQEQNKVEAVNFVFFEVSATQMPLVHILLHEIVLHVHTLQEFNRWNLFSLVDFLVIHEESGDNLLKLALVGFQRMRLKSRCFFSFFNTSRIHYGKFDFWLFFLLAGQNSLKQGQLFLFNLLPAFGVCFCGLDVDSRLKSCHNVVLLS